MDPSHVALIDIAWPNSAFEKYVCDEDSKFGVRIDEFSKLIKRADKKESIEISISEDNLLLVTIGKNKKYKMRLIESSATDTPLPKITYNTKIAVTSTEFDKMLGDIQVVSEYLNSIVKAVGTVAGTVVCEYSTKMPLRLEFKVANVGRIHFYLAPRVES